MNLSIRDTEFFTTAELAAKLKMNVQVITRKVKAGEIYAYKIGKDWRIPDSSVSDWLDNQANRRNTDGVAGTKGRPTHKKALRTQRPDLLEYILAQLEPAKSYTESELQRIISRQYQNWQEIFGELLTAGMVEKDGLRIRRREGHDLLTESV